MGAETPTHGGFQAVRLSPLASSLSLASALGHWKGHVAYFEGITKSPLADHERGWTSERATVGATADGLSQHLGHLQAWLIPHSVSLNLGRKPGFG